MRGGIESDSSELTSRSRTLLSFSSVALSRWSGLIATGTNDGEGGNGSVGADILLKSHTNAPRSGWTVSSKRPSPLNSGKPDLTWCGSESLWR